jgi:hypothetical protein
MIRFKKKRWALWHMVTPVLFGLFEVEGIVKDYLIYSLVHLWDANLGAKVNLFGFLVE